MTARVTALCMYMAMRDGVVCEGAMASAAHTSLPPTLSQIGGSTPLSFGSGVGSLSAPPGSGSSHHLLSPMYSGVPPPLGTAPHSSVGDSMGGAYRSQLATDPPSVRPMTFSAGDGLGMGMGSGAFAPSDAESKIIFPTAPSWLPAAAGSTAALAPKKAPTPTLAKSTAPIGSSVAAGASMGLEPPRGSDWNDGLESNMAFLDDRHSSSKLPFFQRLGQGQGMNAAGGTTLPNPLAEPFESAFDMSIFGQSAEWRSAS